MVDRGSKADYRILADEIEILIEELGDIEQSKYVLFKHFKELEAMVAYYISKAEAAEPDERERERERDAEERGINILKEFNDSGEDDPQWGPSPQWG